MKSAVLPHDPALPGLSEALDPDAMTRRLAPLASRAAVRRPGEGGWRVVEIDILKHKPGQRCALGYTLDGPGARHRFFAKAYSSQRGKGIERTMAMIAAAIPREALLVPRPAGYLPDLRLLVAEYLKGTLAWFLHEEESEVPAQRAATAISALHGCDAPLGRRWNAIRETANTGDWLSGSRAGGRGPSRRAAALLKELQNRAMLLPEGLERPGHRDFYAEQVWDCEGRTALLDLDDAQLGDGALDVGNYLAHLKLRSLQFPNLARSCERMRPVFLEEYARKRAGDAGMESFSGRVKFYEAATLLRLSGVYGVRDRWAHFLPQALLDSCEAVLDARS